MTFLSCLIGAGVPLRWRVRPTGPGRRHTEALPMRLRKQA
jgi:hypothetical protein